MNHAKKSRDELFADFEELVTFAQAYYATEFPNDKRRGCPAWKTLREDAHSGKPPDESLRSHLFICSECFRSYRGARMTRHSQAAPPGRWRDRLGARLEGLRLRWVPVAAAASCLLLLGLVTTALLRYRRTDSPAVAANYVSHGSPLASAPAVADPKAASGGSEPKLRQPSQARPEPKNPSRVTKATPKSSHTQRPLQVVDIDLKEDNLLRGDNETGAVRRLITLTPERHRLRLRMPRGSAAGRYTVRVVDAFGKPLLTTTARSGGRTLTVELDLRALAAKLYRLCLSRDGEAPDCFLMSVGDNPSAP